MTVRNLRFTRRAALQVSAGAALALSSASARAATPQKGGTLRAGIAHGQTTDSLDPGTWENGFILAVGFSLYNYLTEVDTDGSLKGELAESWEASEDASTWTFNLRPGITFHDGRSLTAKDVIASINFHRGEASTSAAKPIVAPIVDLKADGDMRVVFSLEAGNADFPFILSDYHLPIVPAKDDGGIDWQSGVGTGPFTLVNLDPGVRFDAERNPNYWKEGRGHFDAVELLSIVDPTARTNAFTSGEVDMIDRIDLKTVGLMRRRPGVNIHSVAGTRHYTFPMHTNVAPFDDVNVRQALKFGINREEMVQKILRGYGEVGNDHPIGPGQRFHASDLPQREFDPDRARFHLREAGLDTLEVRLSAADAAFPGAVDASVLFSESAKAAGITINVNRVPNDGYWSNVWLKDPFCACYWGGRPVEDQMFSTAYASGVPWNDTYFEHERFNQLLIEARGELDHARRGEMYFEMQKILNEQGGTIVPMFSSYVFATNDKIGHGEFASNWDLDGGRFTERWWFA